MFKQAFVTPPYVGLTTCWDGNGGHSDVFTVVPDVVRRECSGSCLCRNSHRIDARVSPVVVSKPLSVLGGDILFLYGHVRHTS